MTPDHFFELFLKELEQAPALQTYYKFLGKKSSFLFRRNYFIRRLEFVAAQVGPPENSVWDAGCGYGTTAIFLTLNGHKVRGTTLEFYSQQFDKRLAYWSKIGDLSGLRYVHEDLFDKEAPSEKFDRIILQDTLHHVEPVDEGLQILSGHLKPEGKIILVEENGAALLIRFPLFLQRGTKRVVKMYDEKLKREYLLGNENVRSFGQWKKIFDRNGLKVADYEFVRCFPPFSWSEQNYPRRVASEKQLWRRSRFLRAYGFMGVNFLLERNHAAPAAPAV